MKALHHIDERLVKDSNLGTTLVFPLIWSASWNNPINPGMMRGYLYTDIYLHGNWPLSDGRVQFVHTLFKGNLVIGLRKDDREGDGGRQGGRGERGKCSFLIHDKLYRGGNKQFKRTFFYNKIIQKCTQSVHPCHYLKAKLYPGGTLTQRQRHWCGRRFTCLSLLPRPGSLVITLTCVLCCSACQSDWSHLVCPESWVDWWSFVRGWTSLPVPSACSLLPVSVLFISPALFRRLCNGCCSSSCL